MDEKRIKPMRMAIFFLLGAAFSLLETKSLAQMSLLFGSTWIVNGFAFGGILLMVLLASLVTLRSKNSSIIVSLILFFVSLAAQFLIPIEWFLTLSFPVRLALGTLYFFLPIFFANLFFARIFKESETAEVDFGSNILGLVFGGVTEYFALVSGYKSLTIIAAIFYIIAAVLFLRSKKVVT